MERKGMDHVQIQAQLHRASVAFPDAMVHHYESLIPMLQLPDENDRHVMAVAIRSNADLIVTNNLKDFTVDSLLEFNLEVKSPDDFLTDIIDLNSQQAVAAFKSMVLNKKRPPLSELDVLDRLRQNGLTNTANYLHSQI